MKALDDLMLSIRRMGEEDEVPALPEKPVDLLLYAPCPVKLVVKDAIDAIIAGYAASGQSVTAHIPMGCTSIDPYDPIYRQTDPDKLPGMIGSIGFGDFWRKEFVENHVLSGVFESVLPAVVNPLHHRAGLIDPRGAYTVYGVTPYVFMVDTRRLGGLPEPRAWEDILHPRYKGEVVMCGDGDDMADAVVLNLYKDFGMAGLEALAANSKGLMHSSSMVKSAGSSDQDAGAVYVIPAFFAESTRQPEHIKVIWPRDGAAASPLYLLAKKNQRERLAALAGFFGSGFAAIESAGWFSPMDGSIASKLPPEASLKWVGWDFIEQNDVSELRDKLNVLFRSMVRKGL
ncbi:MAG: ABC transporter substrate-binding protein [Desulfovibrio sp.]|jgi:ABC-type Fe3+ transport system substrate-binding protein|nr:ABC transporter substrate-binding protein [Desulfovibrio sp.]MBI4958523.1 ABC transporter substrate-binding protein [Desulfovibrio sp.]